MKSILEKEINERVKFKLNDILNAITQAINRNKQLSFIFCLNGDYAKTQKTQHYFEAFTQLKEIFEKEINMATPYNDMYLHKIREIKEDVITDLRRMIGSYLRGHQDYNRLEHIITQRIVKLVEQLIYVTIS